MNAPDSLTETISRHFDDANDPAQTALLSEQIKTDPEAAISFARAARVHGMLKQSLAPAVRKSGFRKPLLWISSAAAVGIASFLTWKWIGPREESQTKVRITQSVESSDQTKETLTKAVGKVRRVKPLVTSANAAGEGKKSLDLNNYFVDLDIHGMTVENALASLKTAISEVNFYQRPELERLEFSDVTQPQATISSFLPRISNVPELLKVIGIHSSFRALPAGRMFNDWSLVDLYKPTYSGVVETREYQISPYFASNILQLANLPQIQRAVAAPHEFESIDWKTLLGSRFGIPLVDGESVDWDSAASTIRMKADTTKLNRLSDSVEILNSPDRRAGDQLHISQLIIKCHEANLPPGFDQNTGMLMNAAQFAAFKTSLVEQGSEVVATPEMVVREGKRGQISMEREIPHTEGDETEILWLGQRCDIRVKRTGELISCIGNVDIHNPPLDQNVAITPSTIRAATTEFETYIPNYQTALFTLDAPGETGITLCCLTVRKSVPLENGDPLKQDDIPFGVPVPEKPGFVFSPYAPDKGMVDVTDIPTRTKVMCPYTQKIFRVP